MRIRASCSNSAIVLAPRRSGAWTRYELRADAEDLDLLVEVGWHAIAEDPAGDPDRGELHGRQARAVLLHHAVPSRSTDVDRAVTVLEHAAGRRGPDALRNVTEPFVRVDAHEAAAQLFGALHGGDLKGSYGDEARRLPEARTSLERALGAGLLQRSMAQAEGKDLSWASALALNTIEQLTHSADAAPEIT
jgi:hypothetical protein